MPGNVQVRGLLHHPAGYKPHSRAQHPAVPPVSRGTQRVARALSEKRIFLPVHRDDPSICSSGGREGWGISWGHGRTRRGSQATPRVQETGCGRCTARGPPRPPHAPLFSLLLCHRVCL